MRQTRKLDHLKLAVQAGGKPGENGFGDICLVHKALPEMDLSSVETSTFFLEKKLEAPIIINAMTGGHRAAREVNRSLARAARKNGLAMAVGSQQAALDDPDMLETYSVAREENREGCLLANVSAGTSPELVRSAVEMIKADGVQLYLNAAQEMAMVEGDRNFKETLANIEKVVALSDVPVIVKETGCGLSRETVSALYGAGVRYMDVGGRGGTNFVLIENLRAGREYSGVWETWGITTAVSLLEGLSLSAPLYFIASGGMANGLDVAKALTLGAGMAGMAGKILEVLTENSEEALSLYIEGVVSDLRRVMLMTGAQNIAELSKKPVVIKGETAEWLTRRGVEINGYARR
ncbi:MAG: type 2 isopentenyl-diphosphate Delta-isomerase [Eubacteriales bacterium]